RVSPKSGDRGSEIPIRTVRPGRAPSLHPVAQGPGTLERVRPPAYAKEHPVALDEVKRRFVEEVKLRAFDDRYIDKNEEREILHIAIQNGVSVDAGRGALIQVCEKEGYVLESQILSSTKKVLETFAENDGVISEKEFNDACTILKKEAKNKRTDVQCEKMIIELIEDNSWRCKQGMFNHWYDKTKKEVGMA